MKTKYTIILANGKHIPVRIRRDGKRIMETTLEKEFVTAP
jgi:hypothetical protein